MKYFNKEAEETLVCQMLRNPAIIPNVYDMVKPDTFAHPVMKGCYEKMLKMQSSNIAIDLLSLSTECEKDKICSMAEVSRISDKTFLSDNWEYYAGIIKGCYVSSMMHTLISETDERLDEQNGADLSTELIQKLVAIGDNVTSCEIHDTEDLAMSFFQRLDEACQRKSSFTGISTGLEGLDEILSGIQNEFIVIGARPSLGKTALGEQIALYTSGNFGGEGIKTAFIELEMSATQLTERAIANLTRVPINKLRSGLLSEGQLGKIMARTKSFAENKNFMPITCKSRKISDITGIIRRVVRNDGARIVFIDHIGLIHPEGAYRAQWEGVAEISHTLQQLQRELGIPIVVLSQVARAVEGKSPSLADLRGSGAIEEDADTVMFIERDRAHDMEESRIKARINVVKNRNGACGSCNLIFMPREVMFMDDKGDDDSGDKCKAPDFSKSSRMKKEKFENPQSMPFESIEEDVPVEDIF